MSISLGAALGSAGISAGSSLLGSVLNNAYSISAMQRNQRYAREQMNWQKMMSDTAHQREVADLRAANLNPILSATGGSGAAVPMGQSGSISAATAEGMDVASAKDLMKWFDAQKGNVESETGKNDALAEQTRTLTPVLKEQAETSSAKNLAEKAEAEARAVEQTRQTQYWKDHPGQYAVNQWINTVGNGISTISSAVNLLNSLRPSRISDVAHYDKNGVVTGGSSYRYSRK